jgi:hypothetical protein
LRHGGCRRARQRQQKQRAVEAGQRVDDRAGQVLVDHHPVVQGTVRLDVGHPAACGAGESVERPDLVQDVVCDVGGADVEVPAAESVAVGKRDVRAQGHTAFSGDLDRAAHDLRVTRVEPACDVGAGHHREQGIIVTHLPGSVSFAEVTVDVHGVLLSRDGISSAHQRRGGDPRRGG